MSGYCGSAKGEGFSIGHAGELLQGALWHDGKPEPFLVTLPAPPFISHAIVRCASVGSDEVYPHWKVKALCAARLALAKLGGGGGTLQLTIESEIPVGRGCGSSTSDCVAAIRAVANLLERPFSSEEIAAMAAAAEQASDATMFDLRPVAFLPQQGQLLRSLGESLPAMRVVAVDLGGAAVDTVAHARPQYSMCELAKFEHLLALLDRCIQQQDAVGLAQVASISAAIHQRYYPHARWPEFIAATDGALGVACAHSGSLAVALLDLTDEAGEDRMVAALATFRLPVVARYTFEECLCPSS